MFTISKDKQIINSVANKKYFEYSGKNLTSFWSCRHFGFFYRSNQKVCVKRTVRFAILHQLDLKNPFLINNVDFKNGNQGKVGLGQNAQSSYFPPTLEASFFPCKQPLITKINCQLLLLNFSNKVSINYYSLLKLLKMKH